MRATPGKLIHQPTSTDIRLGAPGGWRDLFCKNQSAKNKDKQTLTHKQKRQRLTSLVLYYPVAIVSILRGTRARVGRWGRGRAIVLSREVYNKEDDGFLRTNDHYYIVQTRPIETRTKLHLLAEPSNKLPQVQRRSEARAAQWTILHEFAADQKRHYCRAKRRFPVRSSEQEPKIFLLE